MSVEPNATDETDDKMSEHGYYEVFVSVWNPETGDRPVSMTVDVYGDEDEIADISEGLLDAIINHGHGTPSETTECERVIGENLRALARRGLIMDLYCRQIGVNNFEEFDESDFEVFPL